MTKRKITELVGLAAAFGSAIGAVAPAIAQSTDETGYRLEEVVVTARRREERLSEVPVAANVITGETFDRYAFTDLIQVNNIAPGLDITRTPGGFPGASINLRGIQNFGTGDAAAEQAVSIIVDGIPISRGYIVDAGFFDMESIQVLKGPQSLFFGKNSPAGVVALDSVSPTPGDPVTGYGRTSYGFEQEDWIVEGAVSFPITDTLAMRVAVRNQDMSGGYVDNQAVRVESNQSGFTVPGPNFDVYPQTEQLVGRATIVWEPTSNFDLNVKYLNSDRKDNSANGSTILINCQNGLHPVYTNLLTGQNVLDTNVNCNIPATVGGTLPDEILQGVPRAPEDGKYYSKADQELLSVVWNYRFADMTLSSNTGWYDLFGAQFDNFDMNSFAETPVNQEETTTLITQELRLASEFDGALNFTVGAYYEDEDKDYWQTARIFTFEAIIPGFENGYPIPGPYEGTRTDYINDNTNESETYSVFAQLNYQVTPDIEITAGGRYTEAKKNSELHQAFQWIDLLFTDPATQNPDFTPMGNTYFVSKKYDNFSPEATISWNVNDEMMVYAAYKTGFLAGGIQNSGIIPNYTQDTQAEYTERLSYDPQESEGFEVGLKGSFLDGRLNGDLTLFDYDLTDIQIATYDVETTSFTVGNAASATHRGVEVNVAFQATEQLQLNAYYGYYFNEFDEYNDAPCYSGQVCPDGTQDLSGERYSSGPWQIRGGLLYEDYFSDEIGYSLSADFVHVAEAYEINGQPGTATDAYTLVNASVSLYQPNGPWQVTLMGTNLTDELYTNNIFGKPLGAPQDLIGIVNPSREYRLQLSYQF